MVEHEAVGQLLPAYVNATLDARSRRRVEKHAAHCGSCAEELEAWASLAVAVRADAHQPGTEDAVLDRVLAQISLETDQAPLDEEPPGARKPFVLRQYVVRRAAAAAAILLVLGIVVGPALRGPSLGDVLLLAAAETTATGSARLVVTGEATVSLDLGPDPGMNFSLDAEISGEGAVRFDESLYIRYRVTSPALDRFGAGSRELERVRTLAEAHEREPGGQWAPAEHSTGAMAAALLHPSFPELLLGSAAGPISDMGTPNIAGAETLHLGFALQDDALPSPPHLALTYRAEVWIGQADNLLQRVRIVATGPGTEPLPGQWDIMLDVRLTDFGQPVDIPDPSEPERP